MLCTILLIEIAADIARDSSTRPMALVGMTACKNALRQGNTLSFSILHSELEEQQPKAVVPNSGLGRDDKVEYWGSDRLEGQPVRILSGKGNTLSFCILNSELENND